MGGLRISDRPSGHRGSALAMAVECDGDRWHGADRYEQDLARQRELERCGWTFFRIRASTYYLDPHAALTPLWTTLDAHDIRPVGWSHPSDETTGHQSAPESAESSTGTSGRQLPPPPTIEVVADPDVSKAESAMESVEEDAWLYDVATGQEERSVSDIAVADVEQSANRTRPPSASMTGPRQSALSILPSQQALPNASLEKHGRRPSRIRSIGRRSAEGAWLDTMSSPDRLPQL